MSITFGNLNLDDGINYIVETINGERNMPNRDIVIEVIARYEGSKILGEEYRIKPIVVTGQIFDTTVSGFNGALDNLKKNLHQPEQVLRFSNDRYYTATARPVEVRQSSDDITFAPFSVEFVVTKPFALGDLQTITLAVPSGTTVSNQSISISGTVYARPVITFTARDGDGVGYTTTSGIQIAHVESGTTLTWSGSSTVPTLTYSGNVIFNYDNFKILHNGVVENFSGFFNTWETGTNTYSVTFSGTTQGGTLTFAYNPRYL